MLHLPDRMMTFPAVSVHNIIVASTIGRNMERVSRVINPGDFVNIMLDTDRLEMYEQQIDFEKYHDNSLGEAYFEPLNDRTFNKKGYKNWAENAMCALGNIRGDSSDAPLAYLVSPSSRLMSLRLILTLLMSNSFPGSQSSSMPSTTRLRRSVRLQARLGSALKSMRTTASSMGTSPGRLRVRPCGTTLKVLCTPRMAA